MAKCIFENLTTKQAEVLASWYGGQGEQDAGVWFDDRDTPVPMTDCGRENGYKEILPNGDIVVHCK